MVAITIIIIIIFCWTKRNKPSSPGSPGKLVLPLLWSDLHSCGVHALTDHEKQAEVELGRMEGDVKLTGVIPTGEVRNTSTNEYSTPPGRGHQQSKEPGELLGTGNGSCVGSCGHW